MRLVNDFGEIVRMSERNYLRYLKDGAEGNIQAASKYGKVLGTLSWTATDCEVQDYQHMYQSAKAGWGRG